MGLRLSAVELSFDVCRVENPAKKKRRGRGLKTPVMKVQTSCRRKCPAGWQVSEGVVGKWFPTPPEQALQREWASEDCVRRTPALSCRVRFCTRPTCQVSEGVAGKWFLNPSCHFHPTHLPGFGVRGPAQERAGLEKRSSCGRSGRRRIIVRLPRGAER